MLGIDEKRINETVEHLDALITKASIALDPTEIRGLIVTLNQAAANLLLVSETLRKFATKFDTSPQQ